MKWSEQEKEYKCMGVDRPFRTFEKIIFHAKNRDAGDDEKRKLMDELVISQAPRSMQQELAEQLQAEKLYQESLKIGNRQSTRIKSVGSKGNYMKYGEASLRNKL